MPDTNINEKTAVINKTLIKAMPRWACKGLHKPPTRTFELPEHAPDSAGLI
jgi:hypothetical protein